MPKGGLLHRFAHGLANALFYGPLALEPHRQGQQHDTQRKDPRGGGTNDTTLQRVGAKQQKSKHADRFQAKDDGKGRADTPPANLREHEKAQYVSQKEGENGQAALQHGGPIQSPKRHRFAHVPEELLNQRGAL